VAQHHNGGRAASFSTTDGIPAEEEEYLGSLERKLGKILRRRSRGEAAE